MGQTLHGRAPERTLAAKTARLWLHTVGGAFTWEVFEGAVEQVLVPALRPGDLVARWTTCPAAGGYASQLIRAAEVVLVYSPPYSPDLIPIELAFACFDGGADGELLGVQPPDGRVASGVLSTSAAEVLVATSLQIMRRTDIELAVSALQDMDVPRFFDQFAFPHEP